MSPSLRQFMLISIVGMTTLLLSLLYFHVELSEDYLKVHLDTHNKNLAIVLRNSVLAEDLENVLNNSGKALPQQILQHISSTLEKELRWVPVVKVKVYSKDAMVLFSSKQDEIGLSAKHNKAVLNALDGNDVSGLVRRNHVNKFDNLVELRSLHQQYIPIRSQQNDEVMGVFEIYTDISQILALFDKKQQTVFWSIGAILVIFYIALALSFLGTHRLLRRETRQREAHLQELQAIRAELEKRVEQRTAELDKSKSFLQSVIDGIGNPLLVIRPDYTIALMNNAARELIPKNDDIANYKHCYQISHRENKPCAEPDHPCSFAQVMEQGCAARVRHTHYDANNQPILVDLVTTPLYSTDGEFEGVIEVEHDITQLVQMQAGLEQSEAHLQAILANVPDAIFTCDTDCVIQSFNPAALKLFKASESELIDLDFFSLFAQDSNELILNSGKACQTVARLKRMNEDEFPADIWAGPLELTEGVTSYIAVVRDISKRLQAQQELESTRQQYFHQEKMAAIGQLAAGILHEVGNPIAAIAGAADDLKTISICGKQPAGECPFEEGVNQNINLIDEQTTRLGKITREIADFASPKPRERELLDVNSLLRSTARLLSYDERFRSIEMDLELDKNLPAIVGVADQLTQIFMNILLNAMDASICAGLEQTHILIRSQLDKERVHIQIRDYGCGMSEETLAHALEPFYTTKPVGKGGGLGLSLCETIVLAHGGELTIDSEQDQGTTVHVYLPVDLPQQQA